MVSSSEWVLGYHISNIPGGTTVQGHQYVKPHKKALFCYFRLASSPHAEQDVPYSNFSARDGTLPFMHNSTRTFMNPCLPLQQLLRYRLSPFRRWFGLRHQLSHRFPRANVLGTGYHVPQYQVCTFIIKFRPERARISLYTACGKGSGTSRTISLGIWHLPNRQSLRYIRLTYYRAGVA